MRPSSKLVTTALSTALALGSFVGLASPAQAVLATGDTTTTFALTGGALTMTVPAAATLTPATAGASTVSGPLGLITVADLRAALNNGWTDTVSSTTFVLTGGTGTTNETVAVANVAYASGAGTVTANGSFTQGNLANGAVPGPGGTHTAASGISTTTWTPTLTLTLLGSQVAGVYTGTVSHSVA